MPEFEEPTCDKCGAPITTGLMAAFCPRGKECEFWSPAVDEFMADFRPAVPEEATRDGFTLEEVAGAIARALDEANIKTEVLRGMCITAGLESLPDGTDMNKGS